MSGPISSLSNSTSSQVINNGLGTAHTESTQDRTSTSSSKQVGQLAGLSANVTSGRPLDRRNSMPALGAGSTGATRPGFAKSPRRSNSLSSIGTHAATLEDFRARFKQEKTEAFKIAKSAEVTFTPAQRVEAEKMMGQAFVQAMEQLSSEGKFNANPSLDLSKVNFHELLGEKFQEIMKSPKTNEEKTTAFTHALREGLEKHIQNGAAELKPEAGTHKPGQTQYAPPFGPPPGVAPHDFHAQQHHAMQQMMQQVMELQSMYMNFVSSLIQTMAAVLDKGNHAMVAAASK
ncbi:hypothetical protein [Mycoavidus sp. B2-EB]|uniref:hypothetical protein n=1 Tax=Mycoavidus sp. B2-EB TaxID=2651972 RepID=UPI001623F592|nr:hypothetical protein [Mycoavidus sp. B2-EB]BBO59481.1 hypothetical protein MPB2EB_0600 [Mycoavidus sp. B2-EB]